MMTESKEQIYSGLAEELRAAFDDDSVPRKNIALIRAFDALAVKDAVIAALLAIASSRSARGHDERSDPGLTSAEQKAQGARCRCRGSDDYCLCQNVPDRETLRARAEPRGS